MAQPRELRSSRYRREPRGVRPPHAGRRRSRARPLQRSRLRRVRPHHHRHAPADASGRNCPGADHGPAALGKRISMTVKKRQTRSYAAKARTAAFERNTTETRIAIRLTIEGQGRYEVTTGIRFFDHMLELFTRHGAFDLELTCKGDLDVDQHHTVEDVGIALGEAFDRALGDKRGILRAGYFLMTMDETLGLAAIDLSGRTAHAVETKVRTRLVGDLQSELVED